MSFQNWLHNLQKSDEPRKQRWLVGSSMVVMIVVITVWLNYFSSILTPVGVVAAPRPSEGITFWETMKTGVAVIGESAGHWFHRLGEILKTPRSYIIKP